MSPLPDSTLEDLEKIIAALRRERDETLAREAALTEVLQLINSSPSDLASVFDAILGRALNLCGAALGYMLSCDGESFHRVASRGSSPALEAALPPPGPTPGSLAERFVRGENIICSTSLVEDNAYRVGAPAARALVDVGGVRSYAAVALRSGARLLGIIAIYRREVHPFSGEQIALLQNFAAQAVIAMENARLITETREALERQTATAEVLQVINSSPGDLAPVFDAILEKAHAFCGTAKGSMVTYDGERFRTVATRGLSPAYAKLLLEARRELRPSNSPSERLLRGEGLVQIPDLQTEKDPISRAAAELEGARTVLFVPLRKDGALLGYMTTYRQEVRPFSNQQIALLQNFAAQAVIAMENARLLGELRDRTHDLEESLEYQTATSDVLKVISRSTFNLQPVLDTLIETAARLCNSTGAGLAIRQGDVYCYVATFSVNPEWDTRVRELAYVPGRDTVAGRVVLERQTVHVADLLADPEYGLPETITIGGFRTILGVPLLREGEPIGVLALGNEQVRPFTERQIELVRTFADQAVIAIENTRLITETREALKQQTATAEVLQVINSSPGDLAPVFDAMLERAVRLCEFDFSSLWTFDGAAFHPVARHGVPERFWQYLQDHTPPSFARTLAGEPLVHIPDVQGVSAFMETDFTRGLLELGLQPPRSVLIVSLCKDDVLLGVIVAYRREVRPFSEKQIALLQNFAAQAVIAMENARLLGELHQRTEEVAELNRDLEARVAEQVDELGRVGRLKRFLAPQLAELIVSQGDEKILESHRREIVVVFCDLRGYTAFTETAEPEEVLDFLREYHGALGPLVSQYEGTLDQFSGDGIMVFFNDPVPCADPAERAVKMAIAMREEAGKLIVTWRRDGCELGFGAGIAQGYATLGQIGFSERSGYTAIGTVCNLAARLCAEAKDGQILISSRVARAVEAVARLEDLGNLELKGLRRPVAAFNVVQSTSPAEPRPNLTVVARGPGV
jgi:GAF domain-containing protein